MTKRAKILTEEQIIRAIKVARCWPNNALRNEIYILLSHRCGLRSREIAYLHLEDITDADDRVISRLEVSKRGGKNGKPRLLEMPRSLVARLQRYVDQVPIRSGPLFRSQWGELLSPTAVQWSLKQIYLAAGLSGASSHSGRRTFLTNAARQANHSNCSLFDVQHLAGHAHISSTLPYVELSDEQSRLINNIHSPRLDEFVSSVIEP